MAGRFRSPHGRPTSNWCVHATAIHPWELREAARRGRATVVVAVVVAMEATVVATVMA